MTCWGYCGSTVHFSGQFLCRHMYKYWLPYQKNNLNILTTIAADKNSFSLLNAFHENTNSVIKNNETQNN